MRLQLIASLPTAVPGSTLISHGPAEPTGNYEVIYALPSVGGGVGPLKKLTHVTTANQQVFSLVFCVEAAGFEAVQDVARHMMASFETFEPYRDRVDSSTDSPGAINVLAAKTRRSDGSVSVKPHAAPVVAAAAEKPASQQRHVSKRADAASAASPVPVETPIDVNAIIWSVDASHPSGVRFSVPSSWAKTPVARAAKNPSVEYTCARHERSYKSFRLMTVDLSAATISVPQAVQEFGEHYRQQIARQAAVSSAVC